MAMVAVDNKEIPTLQYVVHVAQNRPYMSIYKHTPEPNIWKNTNYKTLDSVAQPGKLTLPLREISHKITFPTL